MEREVETEEEEEEEEEEEDVIIIRLHFIRPQIDEIKNVSHLHFLHLSLLLLLLRDVIRVK